MQEFKKDILLIFKQCTISVIIFYLNFHAKNETFMKIFTHCVHWTSSFLCKVSIFFGSWASIQLWDKNWKEVSTTVYSQSIFIDVFYSALWIQAHKQAEPTIFNHENMAVRRKEKFLHRRIHFSNVSKPHDEEICNRLYPSRGYIFLFTIVLDTPPLTCMHRKSF